MSKLDSYNGSIELISGIKPKNDGDFPLAEAHDIIISEDGARLDEFIENAASVQTLTTSEYEALEEKSSNTLYVLSDASEEEDSSSDTSQTITVATVVEEGNPNPVSSDAVYQYVQTLMQEIADALKEI